ncbi:MAG: alkaline phosphatase family protein, partial [Pedobacter sp.]
MKKISYYIALLLNLFGLFIFCTAKAQTDTTEHINKSRPNSTVQQQKPYVILISADGFRHDYASKYQATNLLNLGKKGVMAESMIPGFPSVTFPNLYSIVTGMYPSHHGLVNNSFLEEKSGERYSMGAKAKVKQGKWYGGTPLWVLAEQQQMLSASMFW